jgi:hypothetical protein
LQQIQRKLGAIDREVRRLAELIEPQRFKGATATAALKSSLAP